MNDTPGTYYFLQGATVVLTANFADEADARAHFGEWVKENGTLNVCYTLVRHTVSVRQEVNVFLKPFDGVPKLESIVRPT